MKVGGNYSDLWKAIIRPPRDPYELINLGNTIASYLSFKVNNFFRTLGFQDWKTEMLKKRS